MKIGIIGGGVVGRATARAYLEYVEEVHVFDSRHERRTHDLIDTLDTNLIFICMPEDSIEGFLQAVNHLEKHWVIKSTVPIGFTARMAKKFNIDIVHSPEFLTERCAFTDAQMPTRNIIGMPENLIEAHCSSLTQSSGRYVIGVKYGTTSGILFELWQLRFPTVPAYVMTSNESEAVKLFQNAFFATKVSFFNELYFLAQKLDLNWNIILTGILTDGRIAYSHTKVPGPDGKFGFGGKCLPKDLRMLLEQFAKSEVPAPILEGVWARNPIDRNSNVSTTNNEE